MTQRYQIKLPILTNEEEYPTWTVEVWMAVEDVGGGDYVDLQRLRYIKQPDDDYAPINLQCKRLIMAALDKQFKFIVADKNDLLEMWRALEQQFNSKTMSHKIRVIRNLARAHMLEENNMKELVKHVRQLLNILKSFIPDRGGVSCKRYCYGKLCTKCRKPLTLIKKRFDEEHDQNLHVNGHEALSYDPYDYESDSEGAL